MIKAHNETHWAPFNYLEDGKAKGFSVDYMNLLASKLNVKVRYISGYSWSEFVDMLQTDKLDIIINIAKNKQREKSIAFTPIYFSSQNAIYSSTKSTHLFASLKELENKTIAVTKGFYVQNLLAKYYPKIKQVFAKNQLEALKLLSLGKVDATIGKKVVMDYLIVNNIIGGVVSSGFVEDDRFISHLRLGASKRDQVLIDILSKAQKLVSQKEMRSLKEKWFGIKKVDKNELTQKEKEYIKEKKVIKVCTNPNWAPIEFLQNNQPVGISIDILNIISKNIGLKLKYINTSSWGQSQEFLKDKKCDILPSAIKTKQRLKYANFTKPYLSYKLAIVTKDDKALVSNLDFITSKIMSRKAKSGLIAKLKEKYPKINILKTRGYEEAFQKVADDEAYFTIVTLPVLSYYKNKLDLNNLQIAGYTDMKYNLSVAVKKNDTVLLDILNKSLSKINPSVENLVTDKWTKRKIEFKTDYRMLRQLGAISLLIIIIILFFTIKQKRLNTKIKLLNIELEDKVKKAIKVTEKKGQLLQEQSRLAQMGEMISMIAHQWRQPLSAISSVSASINIKANLGKLDKDIAIKLSNNISNYSQHLSNTIDDFRDFFKPHKDKSDIVYDEIIQSVLNIIETSIKNKNIQIIKESDSDIVFYTYPNELKQVVLNLVKNAEDALLDKEIENPQITIQTEDNILTVSDNAGGIPEDIIDKVFDPYFSTKSKNGTGLGLYMSKTIIEKHCGGKLSVSNNADGAVFTIELKGEIDEKA